MTSLPLRVVPILDFPAKARDRDAGHRGGVDQGDFGLLDWTGDHFLSFLPVAFGSWTRPSLLILIIAPCWPRKPGGHNCREWCGRGGFAPALISNQWFSAARLLGQHPYVDVSLQVHKGRGTRRPQGLENARASEVPARSRFPQPRFKYWLGGTSLMRGPALALHAFA